jgi:hypothetical protein
MATTKTPRTRRGTAPGQGKPLPDVARKLVLPTGIASTDWPKVHKVCTQKLGVTLDSWQADAGRVILARRADGDLAVMVDGVGMSLPRQVGKTYLLAALIFAICILRPGLLVIWSAHHGKTHAETFLAMQAFAKRLKVAPYVEQVFVGSGDEEIRFVNGSRILFGARERGFGRGIPGVDVLVFDEAQILSDRALANMLATMNTSTFGLALYIGTPPKPEDNAESFKRMRADAYAGRLTDGAWIEFGADKDADPDDRAQLVKANPSYPHRTPEKSIQRLKRKLTPEDFLREGLGIWDEDTDASKGDLPYGRWLELKDPGADRGTELCFGADVAEDRAAWVAVAWRRDDDDLQVMLCHDGKPMPAYKLAAESKRLTDDWAGPVLGPAAFEDDLADEGVDALPPMSWTEFAGACGKVIDAIEGGTIHHGNQAALNEAVRTAKLRPSATGGERAFQLKDAPQVGPLAAVVRAIHGLETYQSGFAIH